MRRLLVVGLAAIAVACSPAEVKLTPEQVAAESQKLTDYLNAEFEEELAMSPEALTRLGRKEQYVTTEVLEPGQAIRLEAIPPQRRR